MQSHLRAATILQALLQLSELGQGQPLPRPDRDGTVLAAQVLEHQHVTRSGIPGVAIAGKAMPQILKRRLERLGLKSLLRELAGGARHKTIDARPARGCRLPSGLRRGSIESDIEAHITRLLQLLESARERRRI